MNLSRSAVTLLCLAMAQSQAIHAQEQLRAEPVPEAMIDGDRLSPEDLHFSVKIPGPGWEWMRMVGSVENNFQAVNRTTGQVFMLRVQAEGAGPIDQEFADGFAEGVRIESTDRGLEASITTLEPSSIPVAGSFRFSYWVEYPGQGRIYWNGFLVPLRDDGLGTFLEMRYDPGRSPEFASFVGSFRSE